MRITAPFATMVTLVLAAVVASAQPRSRRPQSRRSRQPRASPRSRRRSRAHRRRPAHARAAANRKAGAARARQRRRSGAPTPSQVIVRDRSGTPLRDVRVTVSGTASQEIVTDAAGTASLGTLRDGSYRLRFERDGFITLERDISIRATQPSTIEVALSFAPPAQPPPAPAVRASSPAAAGGRHGSGTAAVVGAQRATGVRLDSGLPRQELHRPRTDQGIGPGVPRGFDDAGAATARGDRRAHARRHGRSAVHRRRRGHHPRTR